MMNAKLARSPLATPARRRSAWSLADQVVSSLTSLTLLVTITRQAGLREVGVFAVCFTLYQLLLVINRPLNCDPLVVGYSARPEYQQRVASGAATGAAIWLGLLAAPLGVAVRLLSHGSTGSAIFTLLFFAPAFFLQDTWRFVFLTAGTPAKALVNDSIMLCGVVISTGITSSQEASQSATVFVIAWGVSASAGAVAGTLQMSLRPQFRRGRAWLTQAVGRRMLGENVLAMGAFALSLIGVAVIAGVPELGRMRIAQLAISATQPIVLGLGMVVATEGTRLRSSPERVMRLVVTAALAVSGTTLAAGVLWRLAPSSLGERLLGSGWPASQSLVLGAAFLGAAIGATTMCSAGLRATGRAVNALRCRAAVAPTSVVGSLIGVVVAGPLGAISIMAFTEWACAFAMWRCFRVPEQNLSGRPG